jgi:hypothetical protein
MKTYFIGFFLLLLLSCNSLQTQKTFNSICFDSGFHQKAEKISLSDAERVKKSNGLFVEIDGVFHYAFEDVALYPFKSSDSKDAMWVEFDIRKNISDSLIEKFNNKRVSITGKVNISSKGHLNSYMATLDSTICIKEIK